ncbi:enoyl-CoA hydratase, partial [Bacillus cereus]
ELTLTNIEQMEGYKKVSIESVYRNQHEKTVLVGTSYGIIRE